MVPVACPGVAMPLLCCCVAGYATVTSLKNCIFYNCRLKIVHNEQRMKVIAPSNTTQ
jgi:hypothetical protein